MPLVIQTLKLCIHHRSIETVSSHNFTSIFRACFPGENCACSPEGNCCFGNSLKTRRTLLHFVHEFAMSSKLPHKGNIPMFGLNLTRYT